MSECLHTHLLYDVTSFFEQNFIQSECCWFSSEHIQLESRESQNCVGSMVVVSTASVVDETSTVVLVVEVVVEVVVDAVVVVVVVVLVVVVLVVVGQASWLSNFH